MSVNTKDKKVILQSGEAVDYDYLFSPIPMDVFASIADVESLKCPEIMEGFVHQSVHQIGVGVEGQLTRDFSDVSWLYFPEEEYIFYRVTIMSNFAASMVPDSRTDKYYSLVVEVSESKTRPVALCWQEIVKEVYKGLRLCGLLSEGSKIVSEWYHRLEYGYPVPFLGRDELVQKVDEALLPLGIYSRGRFGGWKYEVANQDHSCMQGVEAIDSMLFGAEETTYRYPSVVNSHHGTGRRAVACGSKGGGVSSTSS